MLGEANADGAANTAASAGDDGGLAAEVEEIVQGCSSVLERC
jgi:hypothetical protein